MLKIPSSSKITHPSWTDSKAVQLLQETSRDLKHYFEKSLISPENHKKVELLNIRSLQIFSIILLLGIGFGIQGIAHAQSTSASGPVMNLRNGLSFQTIQMAIDDVNTIAGDTIQVNSGTYHENVVVDRSVILKGVNTGSGLPIIDGSGGNVAISITASGVTLQGFTATDANYGIYISSNNNIITGNTANSNNNDGIVLHSSSNNSVTGNIASNNNCNASKTDADGIFLENSNNNAVTGNTANYNNYGNGIKLANSNNNNVSGNTANNNFNTHLGVTNLNYDFGIFLLGSSYNIVSGNTANNNNYGIFLDGWGNSGATYNTVTGNTVNNNNYGIWLDMSSHNIVSKNTANSNTINGIYLLDNSGYNSVMNNTAIGNDVSGLPGAGICLDHAIYNTLGGNTVTNNKNGIFILDSGNSNSIIANTANNNNNDGIYIDNSVNNTVSGNTVSYNNNDGIYLESSGNNNVAGNTATNNGFGIYLEGSSSNTLWWNVIQGNSYRNAVVADQSSNSWSSLTKLQYTYNGQSYTNYNGNYWGDYQGTQSLGIGNTAYTIATNNVDHYPMVLNGTVGTPTPTASPTATPSPSPSPGSSIVVSLNPGWNLIGWCLTSNSDAATVCSKIPGNQIVARYNATSSGYDLYIEGSSPAKDSFVIKPGIGYFVGSDSVQTLNFGAF
jgi:parallel beta-helix repeat protein